MQNKEATKKNILYEIVTIHINIMIVIVFFIIIIATSFLMTPTKENIENIETITSSSYKIEINIVDNGGATVEKRYKYYLISDKNKKTLFMETSDPVEIKNVEDNSFKVIAMTKIHYFTNNLWNYKTSQPIHVSVNIY